MGRGRRAASPPRRPTRQLPSGTPRRRKPFPPASATVRPNPRNRRTSPRPVPPWRSLRAAPISRVLGHDREYQGGRARAARAGRRGAGWRGARRSHGAAAEGDAPRAALRGLRVDGRNGKTFTCGFDKVLDCDASQADVFDELRPAVAGVARGVNACVFAYGQTGAGKTHTILGPGGGTVDSARPAEWGIVPRAVHALFAELDAAPAAPTATTTTTTTPRSTTSRTRRTAAAAAAAGELLVHLPADLQREAAGPARRRRRRRRVAAFAPSADPRDGERRGAGRAGARSVFAAAAPAEVYVSGLSQFRVGSTEEVLSSRARRRRATRRPT